MDFPKKTFAYGIEDYGPSDLVKSMEFELPKVRSHDLMIRVTHSGLNPVDWKIRRGHLRFITGRVFPRILGYEFAGEVLGVGSAVTEFSAGAKVFGGMPIGRSFWGSYSDYLVVDSRKALKLPHTLSPEIACCLPIAGSTAWNGCRFLPDLSENSGSAKEGKRVLIYGASGGVGHIALQIAKHRGYEVVAFSGPNNTNFCKDLGADEVFSYKQKDPTSLSRKFDYVFDATGLLEFRRCLRILNPKAHFVTTLPSARRFGQLVTSKISFGPRLIFAMTNPTLEGMGDLMGLILDGKIKIHIESRHPKTELRKVHQLMELGHGKGKSLILIAATKV